MTINRDFNYLHPTFKSLLIQLLDTCHDNGLDLYLFEGFRTFERQNELYAQGRTAPGRIVTQARAGYSMHCYGIAADLVFNTSQTASNWSWNGPYDQLGDIIANNFSDSLDWAGSWTSFRELPHVQLKIDYTASQLKEVYDSSGLDGAWQLF
jgi:peptidoglycan L-alanyl-D-glutamate endopeptidase CwlK